MKDRAGPRSNAKARLAAKVKTRRARARARARARLERGKAVTARAGGASPSLTPSRLLHVTGEKRLRTEGWERDEMRLCVTTSLVLKVEVVIMT